MLQFRCVLKQLWSLGTEVCLRSASGTIPGLLLNEAGELYNTNRMDQNEGIPRHPSDCPSLFEGNKVTEKKDRFTRELRIDRQGTCWTDMIIS